MNLEIKTYNDDQATAWILEKIEILLSDYSHSTDTPIQ